MELKKLGLVGLGFVAGIAFVVACPNPQDVAGGSSGSSTGGELFSTSTASAEVPAACMQWELMWRPTTNWGKNNPKAMPEGWEPYFVDQFADIHLRRCVD